MLPFLRLLRPHQWVKNGFVVAPLFFTPEILSLASLQMVGLGVLAFCLMASAVYILNDYMDREADRLHPTKCYRPLAAGTVAEPLALATMVVLAIAALALGWSLSVGFFQILLLYVGVNLLYSYVLKQVSIVDVMLVALGYVLRIYAGAELIGKSASVWIIVCTGLVSLFIALAKRRDDIVKNLASSHRQSLKGYTLPFLDTAIGMMLAGLLISYLIYTTEPEAMQHYGTTKLYLTTPFVIMGVLRYLQIALVEERSGAPTTIVLTDKFLIGCVIAWIATFGVLIYG